MQMLVSVILALATTGAVNNPNPWVKKHTTDNGITVYMRDVPNSKIKEAKAVGIIKSSPKRLRDVIRDVPHYIEFMPYIEEAKVLKHIDDKTCIVYQRLNPPIVNRRDMVYRFVEFHDKFTNFYKLSWTRADGIGPAPMKKVVRLKVNDGHWTLEDMKNGATRVTYWVYTDPGGSLPAWIANKANSSSLPDLINAVRNRSANPKWKR